jgi:lipopolysaccharide transport system ATP-binding protein
MRNLAVRAERVGKRYAIGAVTRPDALLSDRIAAAAARPLRALAARASRRSADAPVEPAGHFWALRDVGFEIDHGEVVGVIGRNGAGKSTLLKILARITRPTSGRVELYGRVGALLEVGTGFHPELTGRDNVFLNGAILGMRRAEIARKFDEIVAFAEVEAFIDTAVKFYSSGMRVRLAFAVAAHLETEILLVDEVLAVGDVSFQKKCLGKMGDVARAGRTVVFVSHDLTAVQVLCQRALRLGGGTVLGAGPVAEEIGAYLAESQGSARRSALDHPIPLSSRMRLTRFGFDASPVESGTPAAFELEIEATTPTRIDELAVSIHDALNRRVGLIDFRRADGVYQAGGAAPLRLRAELASLPLVEGEYHAGLTIRSDDVHEVREDLSTFAVVAHATQAFVPYRASMRGVVAFDYDVRRP